MDRSAAESLLAAQSLLSGDGSDAAPDVLVNLLAAATAPAQPHELVGEAAAVVAFRQAHRPEVSTPGHRTLLARLLTVKITAAFALTAVGGVAVAAAGGLTKLPGTAGFGPGPTTLADTPSPAPLAPVPSAPTAAATPAPQPATPAASPHPSPDSLCRIFVTAARNGPAGSQVQGLDAQALAALIASAGGGIAEVWAYCSRILQSAGGPASAWPWPSAGTGQRWELNPTYPAAPNSTGGPNDWRSRYPSPSPTPSQLPNQNQTGQASPQAADRGISPTPTPTTVGASVPPSGGRR